VRTIEVYTDGSFTTNHPTLVGWGIVASDGHKAHGALVREDIVHMRQVGGEVKAAIEAVRYAHSKGYQKVIIKHDYEGVSAWANGSWKAKKPATKEYQEWITRVKDQIEIEFVHVNAGENPADVEARLATGAPCSH